MGVEGMKLLLKIKSDGHYVIVLLRAGSPYSRVETRLLKTQAVCPVLKVIGFFYA